MWSRVLSWLVRHEAILVILAGVVLLRLPSLFEPYWYGDEGVYLTVGQALARGANLYKDIHDNKPPLLYLVAAVAGTQFWFRFIALGWNVATVAVFGKLAKKWWEGGDGAMWATVLFAVLTSLPFLEGNIANAELFFLLPTVAAFGILWSGKGYGASVVAGGLYGLAALFKMPAILEAGVWPVYWLITGEKGG